MDAVIAALTNATTGLTATTFFGVLEDAVPFIVLLVPISLAYSVLKKLIKGASRGKVKV